MKFIVTQDRKKQFRSRIVDTNGKVLFTSSESYKRKGDCLKMILKLQQEAALAEVEET